MLSHIHEEERDQKEKEGHFSPAPLRAKSGAAAALPRPPASPLLLLLHLLYHRDRQLSALQRMPLRKTPLFSQLSLCLSRACLGKMIVFIYKRRKKWRFRTTELPDRDCTVAVSIDQRRQLVKLRESVFRVFPMFVPSLSW